ncbi:MAG: hypothetical protein GF392_02295 [Candidatus Omnitrophica bacterium]|nr:hypothetical protein [Candidatus Omnitrophota bacterium]
MCIQRSYKGPVSRKQLFSSRNIISGRQKISKWRDMAPETNTDFKNSLYKLIDLQDLDARIYDLSSRREEFPVRIEQMDNELEAKKAGYNAAETELKELQVKKNEKETDIKALEEKAQKHEAELYQIKNNKEYKALQDEIAGIKADISILEEDVIKYYDEIESAQARLEDEKKAFEEEKRSTDAEKETIRKEEKVLENILAELSDKRERVSGQIAPELLNRYERILKNRGRIALASISSGFCSSCNMQLRPQLINEVRMRKGAVVCENCGRLLYESEE